MKVEGKGLVAPPVYRLETPPLYERLLRDEMNRRTKRDAVSDDAWVRGILSNAHELGGLAQATVCRFLDVPFDLSKKRDKGVDFTVAGMPVDFKSAITMSRPAIRSWQLDCAKWYVFGKIVSPSLLDVFGFCSGQTVLNYGREASLPSGPDNWMIADKFLEDLKDMLPRKRVRNVVRYPGGKTTLMRHLASWAPKQNLFSKGFETYVELFVGGGAMLFELARTRDWKHTVVNDLDSSLIAIYKAAIEDPHKLKEKVLRVDPTPKLWDRCREIDGTVDDVVEAAVAKLVLHCCSHAGLGYKAGSCQGGAKQLSKYPIGCRWNALAICRMIDRLGEILGSTSRIFNTDFEDALKQVDDNEETFIFADPPYVGAGDGLYRHSMTLDDHTRLADCFHQSQARWLITYDDCELTRDLYAGHIVHAYPMTTGNNHKRKHGELVIAK